MAPSAQQAYIRRTIQGDSHAPACPVRDRHRPCHARLHRFGQESDARAFRRRYPTPWWDWSNIINLNYRQPGLRKFMTEAMADWVREVGGDGYRCDVAGLVPMDFRDNVRSELEAIRPAAPNDIFMLAEWESRDLHAKAFDATCAWSWNSTMHEIATGKGDVNKFYVYYSWNEAFFPRGGMRVTFVSNHDKNAWEGTEFEQFGDALHAAMVLSFVSDGIPMIYNGQEAGNSRRLAFFGKDPIAWRTHPNGAVLGSDRAEGVGPLIHTAAFSGAWAMTALLGG